MQIRRFVYETFQRMGWEVRRNAYPSSEEVLLGRFLRAANPDTVFDVGANIGQYAALLRKCGYTGKIISFEAQPAEYAELSRRAEKDAKWQVAPRCALGAKAGEAEINVAGNSLSSSLLPMLETHARAAPDSRYVGAQRVTVARLDDLASTLAPDPGQLLIKVDTQGYEEHVMDGAGAVLALGCALQLEMSVVPLYEGAPSMRRLLEYCDKLGYQLYGLVPGLYEEKSGRLLQLDGLFLKASNTP